MIEIQPPQPVPPSGFKVFLAGTIDMGNSWDWQEYMISLLFDHAVILLNPRRDDWDSSWKQEISHPEFRAQVEWELDAIEKASTVFMYFAPDSQSPITLLELGILAESSPKKLVVCCPEGYWRKGNVDVVCSKYGIRTVDTITEYITLLVGK